MLRNMSTCLSFWGENIPDMTPTLPAKLGSHEVTGLYRGLTATAARQCPGLTTYFCLYNAARSTLLLSLRRQRQKYKGDVDGAGGRQDELLASVAAGVLAGALSWAIVYPLDLIKTRVRSLPHDCHECEQGMARVGPDIIRRHGWRGQYRGFGITIARVFPVNGIIFPTYEMTSEVRGCVRC